MNIDLTEQDIILAKDAYAREKAAYMKEWRKNNKDKIKKNQENFIIRKAMAMKLESMNLKGE